MTSRGRLGRRGSDEESYEDFQLVERPPYQVGAEDVSRDNNDSAQIDDSSLRHLSVEDQNTESSEFEATRPGILHRLFAFMSLTPLLRENVRSGNPTGYGALPNQGSIPSPDELPSEDFTETDDNASKRDKQTGKAIVSRGAPFASSSSRKSRNGSASSSKKRSRRTSSGMLITEPGHPAGQGGHLGAGLPSAVSDVSEDDEDDEEAISISEDEMVDPPDNSPYPQVRASVAATDDTSLSINTPRMWILSILCAFLGSATNLFFSLRYPSVAITPVIALVVVHPLGRLWDSLLKRQDDPAESFENGVLTQRTDSVAMASSPLKRMRLRLWLAQGNWNAKEHACIYVSSNVSFGFAFATDVIVEQSKFYNQDLSIIYQLLLTISTQILGYAFAGLTRRFLVRPASMIWPGTLMSTAMFTTMHSSENKSADGWTVSRWKFFLIVWSGAFAWYFLPGLLMPALSYFSVITWFAPDNTVIANLVCFLISLSISLTDIASLVLDLV